MAKKTWIKVKRGILEPKHRRQLGAAWYLYFYMLDLTNWEDGVIYDWKDADVAADLDIPVSTLRDHRRKLEDELYIKTLIKQYGLEITINNWTNPREYSGDVYNQVDENPSPQKYEVNTQVDTQVNTQVDEKLTPLHLIHSTHNHISHDNQQESCQDNIFTKLENILQIMCFQKDIEDIEDLVKEHGEERLLKAAQWLKEKDPDIKNMATALRAIDKAARNWMDQPPPKRKGNPTAYQTLKEIAEQEA